MNATQKAFEVFQELDAGTYMIALDGFDSDLVAVVGSGITLVQSYGEDYLQEIFLHEECFKQLIKIMQEKLEE